LELNTAKAELVTALESAASEARPSFGRVSGCHCEFHPTAGLGVGQLAWQGVAAWMQ